MLEMIARCKCGRFAMWQYTSGDTAVCDECVPRGCSCNIIFTDDFDEDGNLIPLLDKDGNCVEETDELGRLLPCCEWDWKQYGVDDNADWSDYPMWECLCEELYGK